MNTMLGFWFCAIALDPGSADAVASGDSERRCAAVLLRLGGRRLAGPNDTKPVEVPITQDELAGAANLSRNSVGTMLHRLKARGLVEPGFRGMTTIRAPNALRAFVDQG